MTTDPAFWDRLAESYYEKPVEDQAAWKRKQAITLDLLEPDHEVLDIGCGTGSLALILAPHARQVHALDISPEMLRIGRSRAEEGGVENVTFHQGALSDLAGIENGSLDMVCAYSILHLVEDPAAHLARIHELLTPGGWLVTSTICLGGRLPYAIVLPVMRWIGKAPYVNRIREADFLDMVRGAGFIDLKTPDVGAKNTICFAVARKPPELV